MLAFSLGLSVSLTLFAWILATRRADDCRCKPELKSHAWVKEAPHCEDYNDWAISASEWLQRRRLCNASATAGLRPNSICEAIVMQGGLKSRTAIELDDSSSVSLMSSNWVLCGGFSLVSIHGSWAGYDRSHRYFDKHSSLLQYANSEAVVVISESYKTDFANDARHTLASAGVAGMVDLVFIVGGAAARPDLLCKSELFTDVLPSALVIEFQPFWGLLRKKVQNTSHRSRFSGVSIGIIFDECVGPGQFQVVSCVPHSSDDNTLAIAILFSVATSSVPPLSAANCLDAVRIQADNGRAPTFKADMRAKWNRYVIEASRAGPA